MIDEEIGGTTYSYFYLCKRKMWFYAHGITRECENKDIEIGKSIDESSYSREKHSIRIDGICIDYINGNAICEVKKSDKNEFMAIAQVKYYLYVMSKHGANDMIAYVNYPLLKKCDKVLLDESDKAQIEQNLVQIRKIIKSNKIPIGEDLKNTCKACAYFDLCRI